MVIVKTRAVFNRTISNTYSAELMANSKYDAWVYVINYFASLKELEKDAMCAARLVQDNMDSQGLRYSGSCIGKESKIDVFISIKEMR